MGSTAAFRGDRLDGLLGTSSHLLIIWLAQFPQFITLLASCRFPNTPFYAPLSPLTHLPQTFLCVVILHSAISTALSGTIHFSLSCLPASSIPASCQPLCLDSLIPRHWASLEKVRQQRARSSWQTKSMSLNIKLIWIQLKNEYLWVMWPWAGHVTCQNFSLLIYQLNIMRAPT